MTKPNLKLGDNRNRILWKKASRTNYTFWYIQNIMCMCFVHSCLWSSTSSRKKSDGWGSSSTRGTCASHSWSWRLRTSKTPSLRAHFKSWPTYRVTFTSSWEHMHYCTNHIFLNHRTLLRVLTKPLILQWAPTHTLCTGAIFKHQPHVFVSIILSFPQRVHMLFFHTHTLKQWVLPSCNTF